MTWVSRDVVGFLVYFALGLGLYGKQELLWQMSVALCSSCRLLPLRMSKELATRWVRLPHCPRREEPPDDPSAQPRRSRACPLHVHTQEQGDENPVGRS